MPEATLVRAIAVSMRGRNRGAFALSGIRPSALPPALCFIGCAPQQRPWSSSVTLLAPGCPGQASGAAFGFDERTGAEWWTRSGCQSQAVHDDLVEHPRDLGQGQADDLRVTKQGGIVWMALALLVKTRLWLGGEVSAQRDLLLSRRRLERIRRCAAHRPLFVCTDGGARTAGRFARPFVRPRAYGQGRTATAATMAPSLHHPRRQALRAATGGRD